jgi:hypothetical protein
MKSKLLISALVAISTGLLGCGGDDDDVSVFVGSWKYVTGTSTTNCGAGPTTEQLMDTFTVGKGIDSPLVIISGSCNLKFDANGNTATIRTGQVCMVVEGGISATVTFNAGTMTVTGTNATVVSGGNIMASGPGGIVNCTFTDNGTAMKISM